VTHQRTRLFVITDPHADQQAALIKALLIAGLADCEVHAFLCIYRDIAESGEYASRKDFKHRSIKEARQWLAEQLRPLDTAGVPHTSEVVWNSDWCTSALHAIARSDCDLVIKSSHHHSRAKRFFSKTSDYSLMRGCACPVLFVHHEQEWESNRVLACVDLESRDPGHLRLNKAIFRDAQAFANIVAMDLYVAAAFSGPLNPDNPPLRELRPATIVEKLASFYGLETSRICLREGEKIATLSSICDEIDPSVVVVGTLARSGMEGKLVGNTAEKLLDLTRADVLTVN